MVEAPAHLTIKDLAEEDRPREKLMLKGKASLSDAELLAILLRSGSDYETALQLAQRMLGTFGNDLQQLAKANWQDLVKIHGMGKVKAVSVLAAFELGRRRVENSPEKKSTIKSSNDAFGMLKPKLGYLVHEEFWALYLNRGNAVVGSECISRGGISGTTVDIRLILRPALDYTASGIILGHNHPSGQLRPSKEDITLTTKVQGAARLMDMRLLDHLIIGEKKYFSFADEHLL